MNSRIKITIISLVLFFAPSITFGATDFVSIIDPDNGAGTDFSSLSAWESTIDSDLTAASSQVFSGTRTGTMTDTTTVYLCRGGTYQSWFGTLTHASSTQAYIVSITGGLEGFTEASGDIWYTNNTCNSATYFTISDGGDSASAVASCRSSSGTADTTTVTIDNWTTSATNHIRIWTDPALGGRHDGKWNNQRYRLETTATAIDVRENYVRIDGLQIQVTASSGVDFNGISMKSAPSGTGALYFSNNIIKGVLSGTAADSYGINYEKGKDLVAYIWNNIFYGWKNSSYSSIGGFYAAEGDAYIYNNTAYDNYRGFYRQNGIIVAKNNISYNNTADDYYGTFDSSSTHNLTNKTPSSTIAFGVAADSGTTTSAAANKLIQTGQNFLTTVKVGMIVKDGSILGGDYSYVTAVDSDTQLSLANDIMSSGETFTVYTNRYAAVSFIDETNNDFHLSPFDTGAKNAGADLEADSYLAFSEDIDGDPKDVYINSWDIGADEAQTLIYRSVGPSATSAIDDDNSNAVTITISSGTATFSSAVENNVGVGDAVVYDSDSDNDLDASDSVAFIRYRTDSTHYILQTDDGAVPGNLAANDKWAIYRAYTSLANAESGTENTSIPIAFTGGDRSLVSNNEQWNIATYANGTTSDSTTTYVSGWTTGERNYIKIYTPVDSNEVGTSQRHAGKWDASKYNIVVSENEGIRISDDFVHIEGLQIHVSLATDYDNSAIWINAPDAGWKIYISECVLRGAGSATYWHAGVESYATSPGTVYVSNCVAYDFKSSVLGAGYLIDAGVVGGNGSTMYVYNSTAYNCGVGYRRYDSGINLYLKNDIAQSCTDGFQGTFDANSDYNLSDLSSDAPSASYRSGLATDVSFTDESNGDFHLATPNNPAINAGANLSSDANLYFSTDIDGGVRPVGASWDIGADEYTASVRAKFKGDIKFQGDVNIK